MYPEMDTIELDSSGSSQDCNVRNVRTFPAGTQSLLLLMFPPDQASWLVVMRFNRWQIVQVAEPWKQSESFVIPVLTKVRQN